jgi:alkanesulfonate monooxygenase SsuD/methylene tetrahydromethanopterin reductase-like flavin-dependent oxidoreductase (luciferase family)
MDELWTQHEKAIVLKQQRYSVVGSRDTVRERLQAILAETGADEIIASGQIYDHEARLRSYQILAEAANP